MASRWQTRGGKSLDGIGRALARKGLDFLDITGVTVVGEYHHGSRYLVEGLVRDFVEETLGTSLYEEISKHHTVLENIHYCQSGLSFVNGIHNPHKVLPVPGSSSLGDAVSLPSLINHDYLVLEVGYGAAESTLSKLFIRAEKSGHPPERAGILITVDPDYEATAQHVRLFTIRCAGKEVGLLEILSILADHSPDYSLRDQNCWQYTRKTAKRLLRR